MEIKAHTDSKITMQVIPGHFATNHSHINYYLDLTDVKVLHSMAKTAATDLARKYRTTPVDTIICLEGTEMLGAFLADELTSPGYIAMNKGSDISVLTPELNSNNQMLFRDNTQGMVRGKQVLLLVSSASTGKTITRALDCLNYYGGVLVGICAVFSAVRDIQGIVINAVFTQKDVPDYLTYIPGECTMCKQNQQVDGIVNSFGYSML